MRGETALRTHSDRIGRRGSAISAAVRLTADGWRTEDDARRGSIFCTRGAERRLGQLRPTDPVSSGVRLKTISLLKSGGTSTWLSYGLLESFIGARSKEPLQYA